VFRVNTNVAIIYSFFLKFLLNSLMTYLGQIYLRELLFALCLHLYM